MHTLKKFSLWISEIQNKENSSIEEIFSEIIKKYRSYTPENSQNIEVLEKANFALVKKREKSPVTFPAVCLVNFVSVALKSECSFLTG